jgi:hyaluronan synthase
MTPKTVNVPYAEGISRDPPDEARAPDHRRYPRTAWQERVDVHGLKKGAGRHVRAELSDISEKGLALRLNGGCPFEPGDPLRIIVNSAKPPFARIRGHVKLSGVVVRRSADSADGVTLGIRLNEPLEEQVGRHDRSVATQAALAVAAVAVAMMIVVFKYFNYRWFWYDPIFQSYSLIVAVYILSRAILSWFYREPGDHGYHPSLTIAIAVKDEADNIAKTVEHCFDAAYPAHLLEVIVVDDGSTDSTWEILQSLRRENPGLSIYRFAQNKGKRHAMALSATKAIGEILVYVDSDSFIERESLYRIVQPFTDPTIGAVAGHIQVIVEPHKILSKMERVRYFISHRVIKASESLFSAVTCCSGAFSAYRKSSVMRVLHPWLNQTFLGVPSTFGDDRSLTNHILKTHRVIFHNSASCWTFAPDTWRQFFRQQLRWKKSWSRETLAASKILYRKHPVAAVSYYAGVIMTLISPLIVLRALVYMPLVASATPIPYLGGLLLVYLFFCLLFRFYTGSRYWLYGIGFAALYIGVLCWQNYYAMLTVNRTHWGTR